MRSKLAIALVVPCVLMGGCGGSKEGAAKFDGPLVPWTASQPAELADRAPASTPCKAADLAVHGEVAFAAYGNGGGIAVIALQNKGKRDCRLEGRPRVRLIKDDGPRQVNTRIPRPPLIF